MTQLRQEIKGIVQPNILDDHRVLTQATQERWWFEGKDILMTQYRSIHVTRGTNCYYLSQRNDTNIYRFKTISDLAEHICKMKLQTQLVLDL